MDIELVESDNKIVESDKDANDDIIHYENYQPSEEDIHLLKAASEGDLETCRRLIDNQNADPCFQDFTTGMSVLMAAAGAGHSDVVALLLEEGAPWNAVDRNYLCAGDYASRNSHQDIVNQLINHAVISEMILGSVMEKDRDIKNSAANHNFLSSEISYEKDGDKLLDSENLAVMMQWEKPLMQKHAEFITSGDTLGPVLNVGFGMGIVDSIIDALLTEQQQKSANLAPRKHFIIEAHLKVIEQMTLHGWLDKPNVVVLQGRWQDVVPTLIAEQQQVQFDGIFFDTYAEDDFDLKHFHSFLPQLLRPNGGRYSFYNGMCPDNVFFHGVACETIRLQLQGLGLSCEFERMPVDVSSGRLWSGVKQRYWCFDTYYLPECILTARPE